MTGKDKQNHVFQKSKSYEISSTDKASNLIKGISSHNIYSGMKSEQVKKQFVIQCQKPLIFLRILLFHFTKSSSHSISCALLIDKPNESCQNSKKFERNAISITKKFLKRKGNGITPAKTNAPISPTSSECLQLIIQTYQMKIKNLIMKLRQLQQEISKASLPVSADLSNDFTSVILETDQRKTYPS